MRFNVSALEIIELYIRKWWIILICATVGGLVAYFYTTSYISPTYVSKGTLYISSRAGDVAIANINQGDFAAAGTLANHCRLILKSERYISIVKDVTGVPYTTAQLKNMINIYSAESWLEITTTTTTPAIAQLINQAVIDNARDEVMRVVPSCDLKIIDDASYPQNPSGPNAEKNTLFGAAIGLMLICLLLLLLELIDMTIRTPEELINYYNIPIMGSIPNFEIKIKSDYEYKVNL